MSTNKITDMMPATRATIEQISYYLTHSSLSGSSLSLENDILTIHFKNDMLQGTWPTKEQLQYIKDVIFWNTAIELPYENNIIQLNRSNHALTVNFKNYEITTKFFLKMKDFGVVVTGFDMCYDEFSFYYKVAGRYHFSYSELEELQELINPNIKQHDSIRIAGFDGIYSVRVSLKK